MGYEYDVFLSYRRYQQWPQWVENKFLPIFEHWLGEHLGRDARIFFDKNIETGTIWPTELLNSLAASKILVPLWSRQYFNSYWCKAELGHMIRREEICGSSRLVVPASIHDGNRFPQLAKQRQYKNLNEYVNIRMNPEGITAEKLSRMINDWGPDLENAIRHAPAHNPQWENIAVDECIRLFDDTTEPTQRKIPRQGGVWVS